jgi:flagellar L-ring protein precursor FlgH
MRRNGGSLLRATLATTPPPVGRTASGISYYSVPVPQPKVIKKHDLVTIIVREESQNKSAATTDLKKEAELNAKIEQFMRINLNKLTLQNNIGAVTPEIKVNGDRSFKADGAIDRSDSVTFRVTAEVIDVKPNGTLVVQARKRIKTDEEEEVVVLSGVCRAEDISADNTILSTQLFDLEMTKNHTGAIRDANTRGWVPRLLDALNPF